MISLRIDNNGAYQVKWPRSAASVLALGQAYVTHEASLPAGQQLAAPALVVMQAANTAAHTAQAAAGSGEVSRAVAAGLHRQALATAKQRLQVSIAHLKSQNISNLSQLEQWGLDTVMTNSGFGVRQPHTDKQWETFLNAYVIKETSRAANERISNPSLAEMTALRDEVQATRAARTAGRNQREANVQTRTAEVQRLLDLLQGAAVMMVLLRHNGSVTNDLQAWGYEVTAVTAPPVQEEEVSG